MRVEIKKVKTYQNKFNTESQIYEKLKNDKPFTIKGYVITIKYNNDSLSEGEKERKPIKINVLDKKVFDDAITKTIKAFVNADTYDKYMKNIQEEIKDTGSIIENINIDDDITYKEDLISTTDEIFTDVDTLAKYLLYGTLAEQTTYIVQEGDTIEDVATNNKLNVQEFLIANPNFTSANNLLYAHRLFHLLFCGFTCITDRHRKRDNLFLNFLDGAFGRSCINLVYPSCDNYSGAVCNTHCAGVSFGNANRSSSINRP